MHCRLTVYARINAHKVSCGKCCVCVWYAAWMLAAHLFHVQVTEANGLQYAATEVVLLLTE